jgi:hypothetical protein
MASLTMKCLVWLFFLTSVFSDVIQKKRRRKNGEIIQNFLNILQRNYRIFFESVEFSSDIKMMNMTLICENRTKISLFQNLFEDIPDKYKVIYL